MSSRTVTIVHLVFALAIALLLGPLPAAAQDARAARNNSAGSSGPSRTSDAPSSGDEYVIGPEDLLSVVFWREAQLSGDVLVRPDGKISLPLIDDVQAAGLTPRQLRDRLIVEARRFITEPVATVVVRQINSRKVYITGQVSKPGQYALTASMTVLQLIATAGGLLDYAKSKEIRVMRLDRGQRVNLRFNYDEIIKDAKGDEIELKPGDTVIVP